MDKIPLKLIKLSKKLLSKPLAIANNTSFSKEMFLDNAKTAYVFPLDKHMDDKCSETNVWTVRVLNAFSKTFETIVMTF